MRISKELREGTKRLASGIVQPFRQLPTERVEVFVIGKQLLRSGTSVAGHAREASRARSDAELGSKLDGLLQEADESQLWLELLTEDCGISSNRTEYLHLECEELIAIFSTIVFKVRRKN